MIGKWYKKTQSPHLDETSLGNMLVKQGHCTDGQLREALAYQTAHGNLRLGQALVNMGVVKRETIDLMLAYQEVSRDNGSGQGIRKLARLATVKAERAIEKADQFLEKKPDPVKS